MRGGARPGKTCTFLPGRSRAQAPFAMRHRTPLRVGGERTREISSRMEWVLLKMPVCDVLQFTKSPIIGGGVMGSSHSSPESRNELVKKKAYELYLKRGKLPGHEMEDWLAAEKIVD